MSFSVNNVSLNAPIGSIVAYVNSTQPNGWLICDGSAIPPQQSYDALRTFLGSNNVPNLQGFFLRGIGNTTNNRGSENVRIEQADSIRDHIHSIGWNERQRDGSGGTPVYRYLNSTSLNTGFTTSTGDIETKPINYGIIWIIKA